MMKAFSKYVLTLCLLLVSAHGHIHAFTQPGNAFYPSAGKLVHLAGMDAAGNQVYMVQSPLSGSQKDLKDEVAENEVEENEVSSSKKTGSSHALMATAATQVACLLRNCNKRSAFSRHFSDLTSHRWYILFRVFRL
ncbi:MAG: hypothetical protein CMI36_08540 [Owenweeksia sp.]|nr:hypothetical protein [Owenweeksia sp.]